MSERWFSVGEIAEHIGVKRDTIYKWVARKNMPAHKVGRLLKFQVNEIINGLGKGRLPIDKTNDVKMD